MPEKISALEPDYMYHIYGRSNGRDILFNQEENYHHFLRLYKKHIVPVADTFCYCLMPNHFHFLMRINGEMDLAEHLKITQSLSTALSRQFSNFFNAYSKAYNKQYGRHGSLFERPFKRKKVENEAYRVKLVHYIHFNPVLAGLVARPEQYLFSSYRALLAPESTSLQSEEVISWFGNRENFLYCHQEPPSISGIE